MIWRAILNTGDIAEEGVDPWVEIPGERLPWARLCEQLKESGDWVDDIEVKTPGGIVSIRKDIHPDLETWDGEPLYFSIQYDLIVDNIMSGADAKINLHIATHYPQHVNHVIFDKDGSFKVDVTPTYDSLVPSPEREINGRNKEAIRGMAKGI